MQSEESAQWRDPYRKHEGADVTSHVLPRTNDFTISDRIDVKLLKSSALADTVPLAGFQLCQVFIDGVVEDQARYILS